MTYEFLNTNNPHTQKFVDDLGNVISYRDFHWIVATDCPQCKVVQLISRLKPRQRDYETILKSINLAGYHSNKAYSSDDKTHFIDVQSLQQVE